MNRQEKSDFYRDLLRLEEQAQTDKYAKGNLSMLRKEGFVLDQYRILRKRFGFGDYPILKIAYNRQQSVLNFKEGTPIQLTNAELEESINGRVLFMNNGEGEVALFCDDFADWIERGECLIRVLPDNKSFSQMQGVLKRVQNEQDSNLVRFMDRLFHLKEHTVVAKPKSNIAVKNSALNDSQVKAVQKLMENQLIHVVHGPPGTGKTTTLVEAVCQWVELDQTVLVAAPANAAVDHFASQLLHWGIPFFRLGNVHKTKNELWDHTVEGLLSQPENAKVLKKLKIKAEEYRKMAQQYKRNFGKEEREQRKLLRKEYQALRKEIRKETDYIIETALEKVSVVIGTPVALQSDLIKDKTFNYAILDEAGQCLLPMGLLIAAKAEEVVLAGDPFQLPPTVISDVAAEKGLSQSILEIAFAHHLPNQFLAIQYRMPPKIAGFSSQFFYEGKLKSNKKEGKYQSLLFIDTAGANYTESKDENNSKMNEQELQFLNDYIHHHLQGENELVFISPYSAQVALANEILPERVRCATIDSFQGQEAETVLISMVRSNENGEIGFLREYRRMNVAITRAQKRLIIMGDSATIGSDKFYGAFLNYVENEEAYKSVFEFGWF